MNFSRRKNQSDVTEKAHVVFPWHSSALAQTQHETEMYTRWGIYRETEIQLFLYPTPYPAISNVAANGPQCSVSVREHPWSLRRAHGCEATDYISQPPCGEAWSRD